MTTENLEKAMKLASTIHQYKRFIKKFETGKKEICLTLRGEPLYDVLYCADLESLIIEGIRKRLKDLECEFNDI